MALSLITATGPLLDQVLRHTYAQWGGGLTPEAWTRYDTALGRLPWGQHHRDHVVLMDAGRLVALAKRHDLTARIDGRIRRVLGIGAVYTPPDLRGHGAASALMEHVLAAAETDGYEFALLFSEIGPAFYERFDFVPVPLAETTLGVLPGSRAGTPAVLLRAGDDRDLPHVAEMSATRAAGARWALDRTEEFIKYTIARRRLLAGLGAPGARQVEFLVTEEGLQAVAYIVVTIQDGVWTIEECGDRDPAGARLGAMLQAMLAREPAEATPVIRAWWPQGWLPPQLEVLATRPTQEVMMLRPLTDRVLPMPPLETREVLYWHGDLF
jgi:GNAT superfamily N-acetyltransferase